MKKTLANWDFTQYCNKNTLKQQLVDSSWRANASWLLPQLLATLAKKVPLARGDAGWGFTPTLRSLGSALDAGVVTYDNGMPISKIAFQGMVNVLNYPTRGEILATNARQGHGEGLRFATGVPLFLSAFKEYRGIKYSEWDWTDAAREFFVDFDMLEYSEYFGQEVGSWSVEELLAIREEGRTVKTGAKAGQQRPIITTTSLTGITDVNFKVLPRLMKLALCQVWVYHPTIRHDLMITDHMSLDQHPEPLVTDDVFVAPALVKNRPVITSTTSMWDV
jgi:hypothetical protein